MSQRRRFGGTDARTDDGWVAGAAGPNELMDGCICLRSELVPFFVFALQHHLKIQTYINDLKKNVRVRRHNNVAVLSNAAL